jgi:rod shape-determining protein MreD
VRWFAFVILSLLTLAVQISAGAVLRVELGPSGLSLAVDFLALLAVGLAARVRQNADAALAGWVLGLLVDLASVGTPVGLYALGFALASVMVFQVRTAVFGDNPLTQAVMALAFCLVAHGTARLFVHIYVRDGAGRLGWDLLQALLVALCTAVAAPFVIGVLRRLDWLIVPQPSRRRR